MRGLAAMTDTTKAAEREGAEMTQEQASQQAIDLSLLEPVLAEKAGALGSLIPILQEAQNIYGYLPPEVLRAIADATRVPLSRIYGIATFYAQFSLVPRGRHTIRVCRGTACHVCGGKSVLSTARHALGVEDGETTEDMRFTLETAACVGACALAPVVIADRKYYGRVTAERMEQIINRIKDEE